MSPISNLPKWKGADRVYSYLYRVLEKMGLENWQAEVARSKKRRRKIKKSPAPTEDMVMIIKALNKRLDEEGPADGTQQDDTFRRLVYGDGRRRR